MDEAEGLAILKALTEKWAEVPTIKEKWKAGGKVLCVAPKEIRVPLHLLAFKVQQSRTLEEAREYGQKIEAILDWVWPKNTPQRFNAYQHGEYVVEVPEPKK
jgi:hypothetical protein